MNFNQILSALDESPEEAVRLMEAYLKKTTHQVEELVREKKIEELRQLLEIEKSHLLILKKEQESAAATLANLRHLKKYTEPF